MKTDRKFNRIAVVMGGNSAEREVSLRSGKACAQALVEAGYAVTEIDAQTDLPQQLAALKPDAVFNALHGRWGEDGCVQGLFEMMKIPYTHSGVCASALAMHKQSAKLAFEKAGISVAESHLFSREVIEKKHVLKPPYVVKPYNDGSSVGVYIINEGDAPPVLSAEMPDLIMAESFIPGRELTTAVMGAQGQEYALAVTDIITDGWYDYEAKYKPGGSEHIIPAQIPESLALRVQTAAVTAHQALGCRGLTRSDFRYNPEQDSLVILELNTQPGMTATSLAPEQAAYAGISFTTLVSWIIEDASCGR